MIEMSDEREVSAELDEKLVRMFYRAIIVGCSAIIGGLLIIYGIIKTVAK